MIREERVRKGLSQEDLAVLAGCSRQMISLYESGDAHPGVLIAIKIAAALGCTTEQLYPSGVPAA